MVDTTTPKLGLTKPGVGDPSGVNAWGPKLNGNFDILDNSYTSPAALLAAIKTVDGSSSGLDADLLDGQDGAYYLSWANFTGKPATFPPTLPITQSDVTNLVSDLAAKAPLASPTFTGDPKAPTPATSDNDTSVATTAYVKANIALVPPFPEAPTDGQQYARQSAAWAAVNIPPGTTIADAPPASPVHGQLWWESDTGNLYICYNDGTSTQWVHINGGGAASIGEAPMDGNEYVRVNGVWRLKEKSYDLSALATIDIPVPAGAKRVVLSGHYGQLTNTPTQLIIRVSMDGVNFLVGASDYYTMGPYHNTGSGGYANGTPGATSFLTMSLSSDANATMMHDFTTELQLVRAAAANFIFAKHFGKSFNTSAVSNYRTWWGWEYVNAAAMGSALDIKALRVFTVSGVVMTTASYLNARWMY